MECSARIAERKCKRRKLRALRRDAQNGAAELESILDSGHGGARAIGGQRATLDPRRPAGSFNIDAQESVERDAIGHAGVKRAIPCEQVVEVNARGEKAEMSLLRVVTGECAK